MTGLNPKHFFLLTTLISLHRHRKLLLSGGWWIVKELKVLCVWITQRLKNGKNARCNSSAVMSPPPLLRQEPLA